MLTYRLIPFTNYLNSTEGIGNSWGGGGFSKTKKIKEMYEVELEFPER